ncbi:uncharacterized protein I206_104824 [Kwoniella pini CBS 10737]|uniref:Uncharacterized protein n=1 Tax=Kwoniella pini CBS 10737 TaxID=1296096 RepID=A0A1B9I7W8_9TREE|nr:uncharacterized protein I206_02363 [Kwoniella pini CBS 10737]OCF51648.1 hypothetical protein I206_02363 [Kwoniella pini CBS 10737]
MRLINASILTSAILAITASAACTPNTVDTAGLQKLITDGGAGYTLQLCSSQIYELSEQLNYTAANQEISTEGYPTDDTRATLKMVGFNKTTSVMAQDAGLNGAKLKNIQIDGNRLDSEDIYTAGGANIEFGGQNQNQIVEYVKSYDPRGWSCLHLAEGTFNCLNITVQNNDIGPCGRDYFQNWADGISLSCADSLVQNNQIVDATDGGIVVFGAPSSIIRNNTISVKTRTMLGGINMVDVLPWLPEGNFSNTLVEENNIFGGFSTELGNQTFGFNNFSSIIKIGIAIGPNVWFSDERYGTNKSTGGIIKNNKLSGGFSFGIGLSSSKDFQILNNSFIGNVSFFGEYGPNCTTNDKTPNQPVPLLIDYNSVENLNLSLPDNSKFQFKNGTALGLTCFLPPTSGNFWPYGEGFNSVPSPTDQVSTNDGGASQTSGSGTSTSPATTSSQSSGASRFAERSQKMIIGIGLGLLGVLLIII